MSTEPLPMQVLLFQHLKTLIPAHISVVDEMSSLLNISPDSAYRRIRGEKPISLEETKIICEHFHLSMDQFLHSQSDSVLFTSPPSLSKPNPFEAWLDNLLRQLHFLKSQEKKHLYWLLKDIPMMQHFCIKELAVFKIFLWTKSILHDEHMKGVKFSLSDNRYDGYLDRTAQIQKMFESIPTTEIWNIESINSSLRQIRFHYEAGSFSSVDDALILLQKLKELIDHYEMQAEHGVKFHIGTNPSISNVPYNMFVNELILGDNTIYFEAEQVRITFLNHSVLNFVYTMNEGFNRKIFANLSILMSKSTMISKTGEKERATFFNTLRQEIRNTSLRISNG